MLQSPDMDKQYQSKLFEEKIYQLWEKNNCFNPDKSTHNLPAQAGNKTNKPFSIVMPPPNANDPLHIGHAMFVALEDIFIRYHRLLGDDTVWIPGTDHAGIETQFVYEKKLKKQGKSRFDFDRETLYQDIWQYVQDNSGIAIKQMKKMGASADWSRYKFTLDKDIVKDVLASFVKLHQEKLIYRENKLVNFCPKCGTSFSNLEINHQEKTSSLYYIKYGPLEVATTRPETMFADIALAVNPSDKRYTKYIDQEIKIKCLEGEKTLKVIADEAVNPEFGTGVLKITPYHDFTDYEIWEKHKEILPDPILGINTKGKLTDIAGKYKNLKAHVAREEVVKELEDKKLLVKTDKTYKNTVSICYRCSTQIEPLPLPQFFIKVKPMVDASLKALKEKKIKIYGAGHDKILKHWLENLNDWNISRQIVWGIRMPVWYSIDINPKIEIVFIYNNAKIAGNIKDLLLHYKLEDIKKGLQELRAPADAKYIITAKNAGINFLQETDTFDTWFSSSQWPFITAKNAGINDYAKYYPTSVMETAYDILPFWVMRMIMMSLQLEKKIPFKTVYLHGLIRDPKGQKMSKSKGNVINPLEIIEKYGADALRMALVIRSTPGLDKSVGEPDFKAARNLTNKLWNAARFVIEVLDNDNSNPDVEVLFTQKMRELISQINNNFDNMKIGLVAETLHNEFWHWYCDICIEQAKKGDISRKTLLKGLIMFLKLFHPFMPFVTESIWQELYKQKLVKSKLLIMETWPKNDK